MSVPNHVSFRRLKFKSLDQRSNEAKEEKNRILNNQKIVSVAVNLQRQKKESTKCVTLFVSSFSFPFGECQ